MAGTMPSVLIQDLTWEGIIWSGAEQRAFTPSGSLSSSLGLSEKERKRYHDHIVGRLAELVESLRGYRGPIGREAGA